MPAFFHPLQHVPRRKARHLLLAAGACALTLIFWSCSRITTSTGFTTRISTSTVHGIVRLAIIAEPNTLNPVLSGLIQEGDVEGAIFNGLVKLDARQQLVPDLATAIPTLGNGGISSDGRAITYHLRHGVTWQDGAPFTSADVAFTYATYANPKVNSFYTSYYRRIERVETPDPYTVILHLKAPFAPTVYEFFERGTGGFVIPQHILAKSPDINTDPFGKHPIGTGPFELATWEHGSLIVLKANALYFGGAPKLREIEIHIIPNPNTQLEMVSAHELDVAAQLTPVQYDQIKRLSGVRAVLVPTLLERFLTFNTRRQPFDDPRVRRALALALDRERIAATAYSGTAQLAQTLIPPSSWAYDPTGAPAYDPALARSLLDQAGWVVGPGGVRVKDGRRLEFGLVNQTEQNALALMAQEIQSAWRDVGVAVDIHALPRNVIYSYGGLAYNGKADTLVDDWGADPDPDRFALIETKSFPPHGYNDAFYSNADVDRWSEQAAAIYDRATRRHFYSLIQRQLNADLPYVPLTWDGRIYAVAQDLRGFAPEPVWTDFWNAETWQI